MKRVFKFSNILLFLLFSIVFCNYFEEENKNLSLKIENHIKILDVLKENPAQSSQNSLETLIDKAIDYFKENTEESIKEKLNNSYTQCLSQINSNFLIEKNMTTILDMAYHSGKSFNDLGNELDCKNNYSYSLLNFDIDTKKNVSKYSKMMNFINQTYIFFGVCFFKNCSDIFHILFNKTNEKFYKSVENIGINNITVYNSSSISDYKYNTINIILFVYIIFVFLMNSMGAIYMYCSDTNKEDLKNSYSESFSNESFEIQKKHSNIFVSEHDTKSKDSCYQFYKFFSIKSNIKYLYKTKNKYYDETNLSMLYGLKCYFLFWFMFIHNYYGLSLIPNRYIGSNFYKSYLLIFVKYSTFSCELLVFLEGIIFSFKFFTFVKKYKSVELFNLLIFFGNFITRIFVFYLIFFILHLGLNNIGILVGKGSFFPFIFEKRISNRQCYKNPYQSMIPFVLQFGYDHKIYDFDCYRYIFLITNQLYCIAIVMMIFYLSHKIKSQIFDIIVSVLIFVSGFFAVFYYKFNEEFNNQKFININVILGDALSLQKIDIMIFTFYLGVISGIIYFYYCDAISDKPVNKNDSFISFKFCLIIMEKIDEMNQSAMRIIFIIITVFMQFIICSFFTIYSKSSEKFEEILFNNFFKFLFIYEKKIFVLIFMFFLLMILVSDNSVSFKMILSVNWMTLISRVGFVFLSNTDSVIYLFYAISDIQATVNFGNLLLISTGLFLINFVLSLFLVILFEMPFRILYKLLIKSFTRNNTKVEKLI